MDPEAINRNLLEAVRKADIRAIKHIFQLPDLQSAQNWSTLLSPRSLEFACEEGHVGIVEFLLKQGNPENYSKDPRRTTLLHRAVKRKGQENLKTAQFLCDFAVSCGGDEIVQRYMNIQDEDGKTALHHAAEKSDLSMVELLVGAGADVTIPDSRSFLPAHTACVESKYETMKFLFKTNRVGINARLDIGEARRSTCLHLATRRNSRKAVVYLLDLMDAEDIKIQDHRWMTAWEIASQKPNEHIWDPPTMDSFRIRRFHQSFPIHLEAACALISHEFESRQDNFHFSWDTHLLTGITFFSFRLNHFRGIYALIGRLLNEGSIRMQDVNRFIRGFQHEQYIMDQDYEGPVILKLREPSCTVGHDGHFKYFTIVMPYFKVQPEMRLRNERLAAFGGKESYTYCPSNLLESLSAPYLPLTLDEYCCPALPKSMLDRRNQDQVLLKAVQDESGSAELVTVCQLWSLSFANGLIIAHDQDEKKRDPGSRLKPLPWTHDYKTGDTKRYIGIMLTYFIENLDRSSSSRTNSGKPILNIFENFIASCAYDVDKYSRRKDLRRFDIDKERKFLHDIDDIRGELGMIKRVILQQEEVWRTFASNAWPEHWTSGRMVVQNIDKRSSEEEEEWYIILRAQSQFDRFRRRIAQLDEDAARIEKSIIAKLDLKQKHASLQEAHATALMSAAVLGFTVITIIFTPLSFLTSLFALSIDHFQRNQVDFFIPDRENEADFANRTRVYTADYIGKWAATTGLVSTTICLLAMWLVMQYGMDVPVLQKFGTWVMGSVRWLMNCLRDR